MPLIDFLEALGRVLQSLQRLEILILLMASAALIAYLGIRRLRKKKGASLLAEEVKEVNVSEEEAKIIEEPLEPEISQVRARALEALKSKGTL